MYKCRVDEVKRIHQLIFIAQRSRNQVPSSKRGFRGVLYYLQNTCPHETRPRKKGEWGKEVFTR